MIPIEQIPNEELLTDLRESIEDVELCYKALAVGITQYDGGSVRYRLGTNVQIIQVIKEELNRRGVQYDGSNRTIQ